MALMNALVPREDRVLAHVIVNKKGGRGEQ